MFTVDETREMFSLMEGSKPVKREGLDFTRMELYRLVSGVLWDKDERIEVPLSSFHRAIKRLKIESNDLDFYSRSDAVLLIGWFARDKEKLPTFKLYLKSDSAKVCSRYAA